MQRVYRVAFLIASSYYIQYYYLSFDSSGREKIAGLGTATQEQDCINNNNSSIILIGETQ
jgi:hypothetical protein